MGAKPPGSGSTPSAALTPAQRTQLDGDGAQGKLLLAVDNETAPVTVAPSRPGGSRATSPAQPSGDHRRAPAGAAAGPTSGSGGSAGGQASGAPGGIGGAGHGGSSLSAVLSAAVGEGGGGGMGVVVPVLMVLGLLWTLVAVLRRRGTGRS